MENKDSEWIALMRESEEEKKVRGLVDLTTRSTGYGPLSQAYTNALMGFDHRFSGIPIPVNAESRGMLFFTRPRLNLSYDNIAQDRTLGPMLSRNPKSIGRMIRVLLDPRGVKVGSLNNPNDPDAVDSMLVDKRSPFIPMLSNALLSMSGWPDIMAEYFSSTPGIAKESWFLLDGPHRFYGEFDLTGSWRNLPGDPITSLFQMWITYALNVYRGSMVPYPEAIIEREIDYQTRIYHFILDPSRRFVQKVAAVGAAVPVSAGVAAAFNFSSDSVYAQESLRQVSMMFHCTGAEYNDPITIDEFNRLQAFYNPDLRTQTSRDSAMVKLEPHEISYFNWYGYPRIDPLTYEFQWWVYKSLYNEVVADEVNVEQEVQASREALATLARPPV